MVLQALNGLSLGNLIRPALLVGAFLAVGVLAASAARLSWALIAGPETYIRVPAPSLAASGQGVNLDYSILSRVTPFRSSGMAPPLTAGAGAATSSAAMDFEEVEETTLDLKLHGLILENEDGGHAFISTDGGAQTAYAVGDEINGTRGVTLDRIRVNSVLLRRNGVLESLTYEIGDSAITTLTAVNALDPEDIAGAGEAGQTTTRAITAVTETGEPVERAAASTPSAGPGNAEGADTPVAKAAPDRPTLPTIIRRMTRADLETMALSIRLEENQVTPDGGVYVFPTGNIDVFAKSGLEAGDLIKEIAGLKLDSRADFDRLLQDIEQQRQVSLEIVRGEDTRTLRVTILD